MIHRTFASLSFALGLTVLATVATAAPNGPVTFNKDVLPILQKNCQSCHRPGEIAPMSLLSYSEARPWAKAMKSAVVTQKMPPWFADPSVGHFSNDKRLKQEDIEILSAWADSGAPEGDAKDKPAPLTVTSGWNIKPDMVIEMTNDYKLPGGKATINYQYMKVKGNFTEDVWISAAEMRPSNPAVLHHGKVWVIPPGAKWMANNEYGVPYEMKDTGGNDVGDQNDIIGKFNPGLGAQNFVVDGSAKMIPKGSDLVFELHYTALDKPSVDRSRVGIVFAKSTPTSRYLLSHGTPAAFNMVIPPQERNQEVVSEVTFDEPARLVYVQPHMHLRGKDYELRLVFPTGEKQTVFRGKFDFDWQLGYELAQPINMPKGTKMIGIAHYDNSPNNKWNPDPSKEVYWGPQNWDEMQSVFVGMVVDLKVDPDRVFHASGASVLPKGKPGPTMAALDGAK
jgi:hypothetical protein